MAYPPDRDLDAPKRKVVDAIRTIVADRLA